MSCCPFGVSLFGKLLTVALFGKSAEAHGDDSGTIPSTGGRVPGLSPMFFGVVEIS